MQDGPHAWAPAFMLETGLKLLTFGSLAAAWFSLGQFRHLNSESADVRYSLSLSLSFSHSTFQANKQLTKKYRYKNPTLSALQIKENIIILYMTVFPRKVSSGFWCLNPDHSSLCVKIPQGPTCQEQGRVVWLMQWQRKPMCESESVFTICSPSQQPDLGFGSCESKTHCM